MARIERSIEIACSRGEAFEVLSNLDRLPEWATVVVETRDAPPVLSAGATFRQTMRVGGMNLETEWTVLEYDPPASLVYRATAPHGGRLDMSQRVLATESGCRVELELDYDLPGGLLGEALDRLYVERRNEREAEHSLQNLKELVEARRAA